MKKDKRYDLEERTFAFAKRVMSYVNKIPRTVSSIEVSKQLVRAAGSVGANYIEANDSLGKKDCLMRMRISRKEAKESNYWLRLSEPNTIIIQEKEDLIKESKELMNILGAIITKLNSKKDRL